MANAWVEHVRRWAKANGVSYGCAVSKPECKASYGQAKNKTATQNELKAKYPAYAEHRERVNRQKATPNPVSTKAIRELKKKLLDSKKPK
jgi:hypothetical protein